MRMMNGARAPWVGRCARSQVGGNAEATRQQQPWCGAGTTTSKTMHRTAASKGNMMATLRVGQVFECGDISQTVYLRRHHLSIPPPSDYPIPCHNPQIAPLTHVSGGRKPLSTRSTQHRSRTVMETAGAISQASSKRSTTLHRSV